MSYSDLRKTFLGGLAWIPNDNAMDSWKILYVSLLPWLCELLGFFDGMCQSCQDASHLGRCFLWKVSARFLWILRCNQWFQGDFGSGYFKTCRHTDRLRSSKIPLELRNLLSSIWESANGELVNITLPMTLPKTNMAAFWDTESWNWERNPLWY